MISISEPYRLLLLVPFIIILIVIFFRNRKAIAWIHQYIFFTKYNQITFYNRYTHIAHLIYLLILASFLLAAASGPYLQKENEQMLTKTSALLIVDASYSMVATDAYIAKEDGSFQKTEKVTRFQSASSILLSIIKNNPEVRFGLLSFSGEAVFHSPPTDDFESLMSLLANATTHSYEASGSSFKELFKRILVYAERKKEGMQVILVSDGEMPVKEEFQSELTALKKFHVMIHTIPSGGKSPVKINIFEPDDVAARAREKRIKVTFHTIRNDNNLKNIAEATGGTYFEADINVPLQEISKVIKENSQKTSVIRSPDRKDISHIFLFIAGIMFCIEILYFGIRTMLMKFKRILSVTGILTSLLLFPGCSYDYLLAQLENEAGNKKYHENNFQEAASHYRIALTYNFKKEVSLTNLGLVAIQNKDYILASKYFGEAIEFNEKTAVAYYNDGHALFLWGLDELTQSKDCKFERTESLWKRAIQRFDIAEKLFFERGYYEDSDASKKNAETVKSQIHLLDLRRKECEGGGSKEQDKEHKPQNKNEPKHSGNEGAKGNTAQNELSKDQQDQIQQARERIQKNRSESRGFKQSSKQQFRNDKLDQYKERAPLW